MLSLELPPKPIFKDTFHRMQISQVPLSQLLTKYTGKNICDDSKYGKKSLRIKRLPNFLVLAIRRFNKNIFFWEKNPSIVNFPIKNLDLKDISPSSNCHSAIIYDLIAT